MNPTIEANILRAFYLRKLYNITYSENCNEYLVSRIGFLKDKYSSTIKRLLEIKKKYPKYEKDLDENIIMESINYCFENSINRKLRL
ncbi:MAG: hypothetical protein PHY08_14490 [Candidatus Cloacimonetes bacterium]|nr:hypothetical protein [Candidatus Cloacimonadota bacterium]